MIINELYLYAGMLCNIVALAVFASISIGLYKELKRENCDKILKNGIADICIDNT